MRAALHEDLPHQPAENTSEEAKYVLILHVVYSLATYADTHCLQRASDIPANAFSRWLKYKKAVSYKAAFNSLCAISSP